jgi:hypothetical protein
MLLHSLLLLMMNKMMFLHINLKTSQKRIKKKIISLSD